MSLWTTLYWLCLLVCVCVCVCVCVSVCVCMCVCLDCLAVCAMKLIKYTVFGTCKW